MVTRLGSILFDYVAGRGLRSAVHSALCLGPHGLYDVLKVITQGPDTTERISNTASAIPSGPPNLNASRAKFFEPSALSEAFRPPFGVPEGDGDASGYHGRDCRLRPLRWKWEGCANMSPINVAIALIVACRTALSIVRSICARRATATAALTMPQTEARNACSKLNAARTFPRAITRKQASQAPPNFSAAGRANQPVRKSSNASRTLNLRLRIDRPFPLGCFFHRELVVRLATEKG